MTSVTVSIAVTAEDIKTGMPGAACRCPVAIAAKRAFPSYKASVTGRDILWSIVGEGQLTTNWEAMLPVAAQSWINNYDAGVKVEPITFDVEVELWRSSVAREQAVKAAL